MSNFGGRGFENSHYERERGGEKRRKDNITV
jgi:hypothetical protein